MIRALALSILVLSTQEGGGAGALREALTFHASFDGGADADFAAGDRKAYTAVPNALKDPQPGLAAPEITVAKGEGKYGDALRFAKKIRPTVFYRAEKNVAWAPDRFQGTCSFWLSLDPEKDLAPGYCDPIQITDKKWDDACLWVDFSKDEVPRHFRLGVFSDMKEWNPAGRKADAIPPAELPRVTVEKPPFGRGKWTHVAFTWEGFNTGKETGVARLYLNGDLQGEWKGKRTFTWELMKSAIILGINYVGLFDDLALFSRALSADEVRALGRLEGGVKSLKR